MTYGGKKIKEIKKGKKKKKGKNLRFETVKSETQLLFTYPFTQLPKQLILWASLEAKQSKGCAGGPKAYMCNLVK